MKIIKILDRIYDDLNSGVCDPLHIPFSLDDITVLGDITELRSLKLAMYAGGCFDQVQDIISCIKQLQLRKDYYLLLQYCMLRNYALREPILSVFREDVDNA